MIKKPNDAKRVADIKKLPIATFTFKNGVRNGKDQITGYFAQNEKTEIPYIDVFDIKHDTLVKTRTIPVQNIIDQQIHIK